MTERIDKRRNEYGPLCIYVRSRGEINGVLMNEWVILHDNWKRAWAEVDDACVDRATVKVWPCAQGSSDKRTGIWYMDIPWE